MEIQLETVEILITIIVGLIGAPCAIIGVIWKMMTKFEARQNRQRTEDIARQEMQRAEDRAQRKEDLERQEAQRQADIERQEAQRQADIEQRKIELRELRAEFEHQNQLLHADLKELRIKLEEQIALRNKELEQIKEQVYNHLPTQIKEAEDKFTEQITELRDMIVKYIIKKSVSEIQDERGESA